MGDVIFDVHNLKFGDKLRTRDGKMGIYLKTDNYDGHWLIAIKHMEDNCYFGAYKIKDNTLIESYCRLNGDTDIIGYWEE